MKTLLKGNTLNKIDQGEGSIELLTGNDTYSAYDLNRSSSNLYSNQVEFNQFIQALLKSTYGKKTGVLKNILEEFTASQYIYQYGSSYYLRVPTGGLLDREPSLDTVSSLKDSYTDDEFNSFGFINSPNTSIFERQLASLVNLDLTEDGNEISIKYDNKSQTFTMDISIATPLGTNSYSYPEPAAKASGTFSLSGTINAVSTLTANIGGTSVTTTTQASGMTVETLTTNIYNAIVANSTIMASYNITKTSTTSIFVEAKVSGTFYNEKLCTLYKTAGTLPELVIISSGNLSGGKDSTTLKNTFDIYNCFLTTFSDYNLGKTSMQKFSLEPLFNIDSIYNDSASYVLYYNRSHTKNFQNISVGGNVTDIYGNFRLGEISTVPSNSLVVGTLLNKTFTRNVNLETLGSETLYPKKVITDYTITRKLDADELNLKSLNFVASSTVSTQNANYYSKIATFDAKKAFGKIVCSINCSSAISPELKHGSFVLRMHSGVSNPSFTIEGAIYKQTINSIRIEIENNIGSIFVKHGTIPSTLAFNLSNAAGITLITKNTNTSDSINVLATYIFDKDLTTIAASQLNVSNEVLHIENSEIALKTTSGTQSFTVDKTKVAAISGNNSLTINSAGTTVAGSVSVNAGGTTGGKTISLLSKTDGSYVNISDSVIAIAATDLSFIGKSTFIGETKVNGNTIITGITSITNNTPSSSKETGALVITGGIGVGGNAYLGGNLTVTGKATINGIFSTGSSTLAELTVSGTTFLNSTLYCKGASFEGNIGTNSNINVDADATIGGMLNVTGVSTFDSTANFNKHIVVTGTTLLKAYLVAESTAEIKGITTISNTTGSTSITNGALVVKGGIGITENAYIGGILDVTGITAIKGITTISNTTNSTSVNTGALKTTGGIGIALNAYIGGLLNVAGTAKITGTTEIVGATTISNTTGSTSITTGALKVAGGVGITENAYIGGVLNVGGTTALKATGVTGNFSVTGKASFTDDTGVSSTTEAISTSVAAFVVSGGIGIKRKAFIGGDVYISSGSSSTSTTTGALKVTGGVGISGALFVGGNITATNFKGTADYATTAYNIPTTAGLGNIWIS